MYLFLAALGLSCGEWWLLLPQPVGPGSGLSGCSPRGQRIGTGATWPRRGEPSWTRDAPVPGTGRQTLNPQTDREALLSELHMLLLTDGENESTGDTEPWSVTENCRHDLTASFSTEDAGQPHKDLARFPPDGIILR